MFEKYYDRKQIKKADIDNLGIDLAVFDGCFDNETPKMYKELHMDRYIKKIAN